MTQADQRTPILNPAEPDPDSAVLLSHDIRSALSQVLGASQVLEGAGLSDENAALVARVKTAALYIDGLLSHALQEPDELSVTETAPVMAQLASMWTTTVQQEGLQFKVSSKGVIPGAIRIPQFDFLRIFNNIMANALKFTNAGLLEIRLTRGENGSLVIDVLDEGPGFSAEAMAMLFSLHGRPEDSPAEGSGLGLYIARTLVEKVGGKIVAENRPSSGARVRIVFPEDLLILSGKPASAPPRPKTGLPDLSHLRILLAEDNPTNQLVATQMLKKMDAVVETASDGVEAMERFENGDYNLGLIDIEMPRKSGLEVMREMRAREDSKSETTLLALTAYVLPEHRERITNAGADGIIAKPLTDIAAFGNGILIYTGEAEIAPFEVSKINPDADIQMDIYNGLKEIIGHDSMQELLGKVLSDLDSVRLGVREGLTNKDVLPIRANTHILISVAGAIGAVNLQHIAEALNATAKSGDWAEITPESERCEAGIAAVLKFVESELDSE